MSWSRRDVLRVGAAGLTLMAGSSLLTACGWKPMYGNASTTPSGNGTVDANLAAISIKEPFWERTAEPFGLLASGGRAKYDARTSQVLHNALRDGLNPYGQPTSPVYTLTMKLSEYITATVTADGGDTKREDLTLSCTYVLGDAKANELLKDKARAILAYSVLQEPYQDLIARNDARECAARQLAEFIKLRLSSYFATHG
jgi:hypothetical protein